MKGDVNNILVPLAVGVLILGISLTFFGGDDDTNDRKIKPIELDGSGYSHDFGQYSVEVPDGWFVYEPHPAISFMSPFDKLDVIVGGDGFSLGPLFNLAVSSINDISDVETPEEWLSRNGLSKDSDFDLLIEREEVVINDIEMTRAIQEVSQSVADGNLLYYIHFFPDHPEKKILTVSHYPYEPESEETKTFEKFIQTLELLDSDSDEELEI